MYCPNCRSEFRPGFQVCATCDFVLVDELTPITEPDRRLGNIIASVRRRIRLAYHPWQLVLALAVALVGPGLTHEGDYVAIGLQLVPLLFTSPSVFPLLLLLYSIYSAVSFLAFYVLTGVWLLLAARFRLFGQGRGQRKDSSA